MNQSVQLAGFMVAHAMMQVAKGHTLGSLIIFEKTDGNAHFVRVSQGDQEESVAQAERILKENADGAARGVMAFDAYLNLPEGRTDAFFLHAREFTPDARPILMAAPYRRGRKPAEFVILRPKMFAFEDEQLPDPTLMTAFFEGIKRHETGGPFWRQHYRDGG